MTILGRLAEKLGVPPMVQRMEGVIRGKSIIIRTSSTYTIITVDGLELFFNRESGKYDGYAESVNQPGVPASDESSAP